VRVNAFALALTCLWKRPLPDVLRHYVMTPIGASDAWHWEGYRNSFVVIGHRRVAVVPGGGHWGGGMFISAHDLARMGLLGLNNGVWDGRRILSDAWIKLAKTPTGPNPGYGYELVPQHRPQAVPGGARRLGRLHRQWRQHRVHRLPA